MKVTVVCAYADVSNANNNNNLKVHNLAYLTKTASNALA